jgi:hypothetical protein
MQLNNDEVNAKLMFRIGALCCFEGYEFPEKRSGDNV